MPKPFHPHYYLYNEDGSLNEEAVRLQREADLDILNHYRNQSLIAVFGIIIGLITITIILFTK